ncbi:F-box only protein 21 isoform X2 [Hydra vulgaris]|uniref:F-box only protein 21 isoform X2 n=1 Tax=Hydra vulgaris TaxID=6087 RepID=UPI0032EA4DA9
MKIYVNKSISGGINLKGVMPVSYVKLDEFAKELLEYIFNQNNIDYKDLINLSKCCRRFYIVCQNDHLWKNKILTSSCELDTKYYAEKIYNHVFYKKLKQKWNDAVTNDSLLKGAVLISKWCNPNSFVSRKTIENQIDDVVSLIKNTGVNIDDISQNSSLEQVMELVQAINLIVYSKMRFQGNSDFYYDIHNSFIDLVLQRRTGIPISLGVLYIVIAKKLGLTLQGVNFPGHFLLCGNAKKDGKEFKFYLDAFNNGEVLTENQCLERFLPDVSRSNAQRETLFRKAQTKEIFIRMIANVVNIHRHWASLDSSSLETLQSSLELMLLLSPNDDESRLLLSRIYLHYGINFKLVVENLRYLIASSRRFDSNILDQLLLQSYEKQNLTHNQRDPKLKSSCENKDVLYRIGMVMRHLRYNYICVIYGWDNECIMNEEWKMQMGIYNLKHKDKQPYYNVLVDDGSTHYVAQENIVQTKMERVINHKEIGKHFKRFNGNYYEATEMLLELFPEDQMEADKHFFTEMQD